jgi:endonuclease/exonuclease/phosphatase family metal-dependent hydrolase
MVTFGPAVFSTFNQVKEKGDVRVVTWNTGLMNYMAPDTATAIRNNAEIFSKLKESDADILCLQEFFTAVVPDHRLNFIEYISKTLNYPYYYFSRDISKFDGKFFNGTIIFSRFAIVDTQKIVYPTPFMGSVIRAGVLIAGDTVDIITTRLQSVYFQRKEYQELNNLKNGMDSGLAGARNIIHKLRLGYKRRIAQVELVKGLISKSNRPLIFTGDLNDIPVSYTYTAIKNNLKDAWSKKGAGLGRTFAYISPTLRIDQLFFNGHFTARQAKRILAEGVSDHNAVMADLELKKE